jgi:hypothetical protein
MTQRIPLVISSASYMQQLQSADTLNPVALGTGTADTTTFLRGDGTWDIPPFISSISITTANGISGTSSGGATPSLTLSLGAITPTSINGNTITTGTGTITLDNGTISLVTGSSLSISSGYGVTLTPVGITSLTLPTSGSLAVVNGDLGTPTAAVLTNATGTATNLIAGAANGLVTASTVVAVNSATAPTSGQVLTAINGTSASWQNPSLGTITSVNGTANQISASTVSGAVTISLPSAVTFPGTVTLNADPTTALGAVTKQYVDAAVTALNVHPSVQAATTVTLTATYTAGTTDASGGLGINATLTNSGTQAAFAVDSYTALLNDRILVKNQSTQTQNGIYYVSDLGSGSTNWILTRATDYNDSIAGQVDAGDFTFVQKGSANAGISYVQTNIGTGTGSVILIGTDNISFTQFNSAGSYTAGTNISIAGTVIATVANPTFTAVTTAALTSTSGIIENNATISANYTITPGNNAHSAGPITVSTGVIVTIPTGSVWTII